jgi:cyclophilin family peptidyl-prolyl cis-trans isomerase
MHRAANVAQQLRFARQPLAMLAVAALCALCGCGSGSDDPVNTSAVDDGGAVDDVDLLHPTVRVNTNQGTIVVQLDGERAPGTVRNFLNYLNNGFYSNTLIHFAAPDKMIVGGGYSPDGLSKSTDPPIRNEAHNGWKNTRGTIAMARDVAAGIDSATSQFFINLVDSPSFDHRGDSPDDYGYCVFGEVTEGLDVADKISRAGTRDMGGDLAQTPDPPVIVESVEIVR